MTRPTPDPFDALRAADPAHGAPVPSESQARVWARVQEDTMNQPSPSVQRRQNWVLAFGAATVAAFAIWAFVARPPSLAPSQDPVGGGAAGGGAAGICLAFSLDELAMRQFAFDGTVTAVDGDQVTFDVLRLHAGLRRGDRWGVGHGPVGGATCTRADPPDPPYVLTRSATTRPMMATSIALVVQPSRK
jgi:hypothetical protein